METRIERRNNLWTTAIRTYQWDKRKKKSSSHRKIRRNAKKKSRKHEIRRRGKKRNAKNNGRSKKKRRIRLIRFT